MHVCVSGRLFASLFDSGSCRATEQSLPFLPRRTATEMLPEIFNSEAAVDSTATLESMSHGSEGEKQRGRGEADELEERRRRGGMEGEGRREDKRGSSRGAIEMNDGWSGTV